MELLEKLSLENGIVSDLFESVIAAKKPQYKAKIALVGIGLEEHFDWQSILKNYSKAKAILANVLPKERFQLQTSIEPIQSKDAIYT